MASRLVLMGLESSQAGYDARSSKARSYKGNTQEWYLKPFNSSGSPDHFLNVLICVQIANFYCWVLASEHSKDFICEALSYLFDPSKIQRYFVEAVDS